MLTEYRNWGLGTKAVFWVAAFICFLLIFSWITVWPQSDYPTNKSSHYNLADYLNFIGALISAIITSIVVWFIWWRDNRAKEEERRSTLYAFYGYICSIQENFMEQQITQIGLFRPVSLGIYIPTYKMPAMEHILRLYTYLTDSPILSRLIIELETIEKAVNSATLPSPILSEMREKAIAVCELLKLIITKHFPELKNKVIDPTDTIRGTYNMANLNKLRQVLPQNAVMQAYESQFGSI